MSSSTLQQLLQRSSMPKLAEPGPSADELRQIASAGLLAPDHGYLRPTRLHAVSGEGLTRLGDVFVRAHLSENPQADDDEVLERIRRKPLRAPLILVVGCRPVAHGKIPGIEQVASTAAAVSLMQTAIDALGYASMWRTGNMAYSPLVKRAFGLSANDHLLAFLYVGTAAAGFKRRTPLDVEQYLTYF